MDFLEVKREIEEPDPVPVTRANAIDFYQTKSLNLAQRLGRISGIMKVCSRAMESCSQMLDKEEESLRDEVRRSFSSDEWLFSQI